MLRRTEHTAMCWHDCADQERQYVIIQRMPPRLQLEAFHVENSYNFTGFDSTVYEYTE